MQIESLELHNYRLFRSAELKNLSRMSVIVGANGSGKTTLSGNSIALPLRATLEP